MIYKMQLVTLCFFLMFAVLASFGNKLVKQRVQKPLYLQLPIMQQPVIHGSVFPLHMDEPLQSGQSSFVLLCSHISLPLHSFQRDFRVVCSHILLPPRSLHRDLILLCSQVTFVLSISG